MFDLGGKELIVLAIVLILLFGTKKIPELAKSLVEAIQHLKGVFKDSEEIVNSANTIAKNTKK